MGRIILPILHDYAGFPRRQLGGWGWAWAWAWAS
jgi:hypothetical protein